MSASFLSILSLFVSFSVNATPHPSSDVTASAAVYLKPYSAVPTGHYNIAQLKKNMVSHTRVRWAFVKNQRGETGWTLKHQLLNPLHFSTRARLMVGAPLFKDLKDRAPTKELTPTTETTVSILDVQNEWILIFHKEQAVWTNISQLFPIEKDAGYFFARSDLVLTETAQIKSKNLKRIPAGARLNPLETKGNWVKVSYDNQKGYVPTSGIVSRLDIAQRVKTAKGFEPSSRELLGQKVFAIFVNPLWLGSAAHTLPMYQQPSVSAAVVAQILPWENLIQQDSVEQEWAISYLRELNSNVWWELKNDNRNLQQLTQLKIKDVRKVLPNPVFSHLKVAAAHGLFRSTDGIYWAPIRDFQGHNPAFTFSKDGILFVEDKMSFDNGEHFTSYVMWDNLLRSLQENRLAVTKSLKILNIESINSTSKQLILELEVGAGRPIKAYTADRGVSWSILK